MAAGNKNYLLIILIILLLSSCKNLVNRRIVVEDLKVEVDALRRQDSILTKRIDSLLNRQKVPADTIH
jgi:hypothetical protein